MTADRPRPPSGPGHYLRDLVYGANDGVITTLAVVAGVSGAALPAGVAVVLGLANLVADGISMGASNYLGLKSELEQTGASVRDEHPWRHGLATLAAFVAAGAIPLLTFAFPPTPVLGHFGVSAILSGVTLAFVGAMRAPMTRRSYFASAFEMVLVGSAAAAAAFGIGALVGAFL